MVNIKWNSERGEELEALDELLNLVVGLNNGSGVITKLERCIEIASNLTETDIHEQRTSFVNFLFSEYVQQQTIRRNNNGR